MTRVVAFVGSRLVLWTGDEAPSLPTLDVLEELLGRDVVQDALVPVELSDERGVPLQALALPEGFELSQDFRLDGLRVAWHDLSAFDYRLAATARQKVEWFTTHRYCSRCGTENTRDPIHEAMTCPSCGQLHFPRVSPAVIVLVQRGHEALLARSPHFKRGVYSTLAGFVEPGESLEECVHREIGEEVGVRVGNIRYFGSQPHPFPHSLMIGFVADWIGGEIRPDPSEIEDARWFEASELPELPHPMSIARALIEDFRARTEGRP
jgi:NAD+ diphosphatase